jgi:hypothetical protein
MKKTSGFFKIGILTLASGLFFSNLFGSQLRSLAVTQIKINYQIPANSYFRSAQLNSSNEEQGDAYYFNPITSEGKAILAILLAAKSTSNKVRVDCDGPSFTVCNHNVVGDAMGIQIWAVTQE